MHAATSPRVIGGNCRNAKTLGGQEGVQAGGTKHPPLVHAGHSEQPSVRPDCQAVPTFLLRRRPAEQGMMLGVSHVADATLLHTLVSPQQPLRSKHRLLGDAADPAAPIAGVISDTTGAEQATYLAQRQNRDRLAECIAHGTAKQMHA
jgi:hypothetical protein